MKEECQCQKKEMMLVCTYFVLFVINAAIVWLANALFPNNVVLGTWSISKPWAIIHSMGILALIDTFTIPFIRICELKYKKNLTSMHWMIIYFLVNTGGIWLIARFAGEIGLGISSWLVAILLGIVFDLFQGLGMKWVGKMEIKKYL